MSLFTSSREKRLWLWSLAVVVTIFSTLFIGQPLVRLYSDQNVRAIIFSLGMLLVGAAMLVHTLKTKPGKVEIAVMLGLVAVYVMFILRLGMAERSHLIEYSTLAILVHKAILERVNQGVQVPMPHLLAFIAAFLIGVLDECLQIFLPDREFDLQDIFFNGMAVAMAIGSSVLFSWVRKWIGAANK